MTKKRCRTDTTTLIEKGEPEMVPIILVIIIIGGLIVSTLLNNLL